MEETFYIYGTILGDKEIKKSFDFYPKKQSYKDIEKSISTQLDLEIDSNWLEILLDKSQDLIDNGEIFAVMAKEGVIGIGKYPDSKLSKKFERDDLLELIKDTFEFKFEHTCMSMLIETFQEEDN